MLHHLREKFVLLSALKYDPIQKTKQTKPPAKELKQL